MDDVSGLKAQRRHPYNPTSAFHFFTGLKSEEVIFFRSPRVCREENVN